MEDINVLQLLHLNYRAQSGCYITSIDSYDNKIGVVKSKFVSSIIWNHYYLFPGINIDDLSPELKNIFNAIYIQEADNLSMSYLISAGFSLQDIEAWMHKNLTDFFSFENSIKGYLVQTEDQKLMFADELARSFEPEYKSAFLNEQKNGDKKIYHYLYYRGSEFVGTGTLYIVNDVGFIHNIATNEKFRYQGVSKGIVNSLCKVALTNGVTNVYLQCNGGPMGHEHVYESSGFNLIFRRYGFYSNRAKK